jgi:beta-galactosidase/beta-glucuronidase
MRDEIIRSKKIGLNGNRIHIKVEVPRKLYWADKLGLLIMADVPNSWGDPDSLQQKEWEVAMRGMIDRDYNHPSIFSWVLWNETWGLFTTIDKEKNKREYIKETQEWVRSMYQKVKKT